jgi:hypothetical protein
LLEDLPWLVEDPGGLEERHLAEEALRLAWEDQIQDLLAVAVDPSWQEDPNEVPHKHQGVEDVVEVLNEALHKHQVVEVVVHPWEVPATEAFHWHLEEEA